MNVKCGSFAACSWKVSNIFAKIYKPFFKNSDTLAINVIALTSE